MQLLAGHRPHAVILQTADWICSVHRIGDSGDAHPAAPSPASLIRLQVTGQSIRSIVESVQSEPLLSLLLPV